MAETEYRLLDNLNSAILLFDGGLALSYVNPAGESMFAMSANNMIGRHIEQLIHCPLGLSGNHLCLAMESHRPFTQRGVVISLAEDQDVTVDCTAIPLVNNNGSTELLLEMQQIDRQLRINKEKQLITQQRTAASVVRNLAHEIKNPLGGLRGAAQLLQQELSDPAQQEYTQVIIAEADRLQALVDRLLGPNKRPRFGQVNIHQILERVRQLILAESAHSIAVELDYDPSIPEFRGDPDLLIQALLNIAGNAARAAGEGGHVRFRTRIQRQFTIINKRHRLVLQVDIQDDGPGIPPELQERIFFPMVSGREGGVGIGLSIAQSLVNQHGGLIEFTSRSGNTTFSLLLPLERINA